MRVADVRPGKWWMQLLSRAFWSVEREGEKRAAWANSTSSAGVADAWLVAMLAWSGCRIVAANAACVDGCCSAVANCVVGCDTGVVGIGAVVVSTGLVVDVLAMVAALVVASVVEEECCDDVSLDGRSSIQSLVSCDLVPVIMISLVVLLRTVMVVASRVAMQPASHKLPMDRSAWVWRSGKRCANCASASNEGRQRSPLWVDLIRWSLAMDTGRPGVAGCAFFNTCLLM